MLTKKELADCIERTQQGDEAAFELLYDSYSSALFGISQKIIGNTQCAEDVVQEVFVKVWKNINRYDKTKGSFFTWILNINRNTAIDKYRKLSKAKLIPIQTNENFVDLGGRTKNEMNIDKIGLSDLVEVLPEKQQEIIHYIYFKGFTQQETADALNLPLGTVKTRSRKALQELRELFTLLLTWI